MFNFSLLLPKKGNSCNGHHSTSKGAQDVTVPFIAQVHDPTVVRKYKLLYVLLLLKVVILLC